MIQTFCGGSPILAAGPDAQRLRVKVQARLALGDTIAVSSICDYEARRELLRRKATAQLSRLDQFIAVSTYLPLDTPTLHRAAQMWAIMPNQGMPTADDENIDVDVILAAQAVIVPSHQVATTNVKHLSRLCKAIDWQSL